MESLYEETNRLVQEAQQYFQQLEPGRKPLHSKSEEIEREIQGKIDNITANCQRLDIMIYKCPITQRQIAKMRCDQLKYDNRHMQAALTNIQERRQRFLLEKQEREQLLSRRFTSNDSNPHTSIDLDYSMAQNNSLNNAHRGVDDMLMTGSNVLTSLKNQRDALKGAHRRIIDMANTLGLSNTTISLIEKRAKQDKYFLIGGMLFTLFIVAIIVIYFT